MGLWHVQRSRAYPRRMSQSDDAPPAPTDTGYFTDTDQLESDVPKAVADPDRGPPENTIDPPPTPLEASTPERDRLIAEIRAALGSDAAAVAALDRLAQSGGLDADCEIAPNLAAMAGRRRTPALMLNGIDPGLMLAQLVRHVENPLRVMQGRGRGTCGAATVEYLMLRTRPAEMCRLVDGLTGLDQKVAMRSGASLELPPTAIERDDSGRVDLDRLVQSAFMARATTMHWIFDYDNQKDHGDLWSEIQGNSLIPLSGFGSLYDDATGVSHSTVSTLSTGAETIAARVEAELAKGGRVPVLTGFTAPGDLHWLTAEKIDAAPTVQGKRWAYLRNPWGKDEDGQGQPTRWPLTDGGGRIAMELPIFVGILHGAVLES